MWLIFCIPFTLQALLIGLDEGCFHIKRGLPRWERIGHPIDTFSVLLCFAYVLLFPFSKGFLQGYVVLSIVSCLLVTKDEFIHKHHCPALEQWLHALLFLNHPVILTALGLSWPIIRQADSPSWLAAWVDAPEKLYAYLVLQSFFIALFLLYQIVYWNFIWKQKQSIDG
ncbi:MAG: hypothetical protein ACM3JI_03070 [Anaerolineae bacterium]